MLQTSAESVEIYGLEGQKETGSGMTHSCKLKHRWGEGGNWVPDVKEEWYHRESILRRGAFAFPVPSVWLVLPD